MNRASVILFSISICSCANQSEHSGNGIINQSSNSSTSQTSQEFPLPDSLKPKSSKDIESEKSHRVDLDAALDKASKESKNFNEYDHSLSAISQLLEYQRISQRGDMIMRFRTQENEIRNMVAYPWQIAKIKQQVLDTQSRELEAYQLRVAMEDGKIDLARKLAKASANQKPADSSAGDPR